MLCVAEALAFAADWRDPGQGMVALGFAIIGVVIVNRLVFILAGRYHAERTLAALQKLLPRPTKAMRDGSAQRIPAAELVLGDLILLESGDNVPADCRLVEAFGVRLNNASITLNRSRNRARPKRAMRPSCCARNILFAARH